MGKTIQKQNLKEQRKKWNNKNINIGKRGLPTSEVSKYLALKYDFDRKILPSFKMKEYEELKNKLEKKNERI